MFLPSLSLLQLQSNISDNASVSHFGRRSAIGLVHLVDGCERGGFVAILTPLLSSPLQSSSSFPMPRSLPPSSLPSIVLCPASAFPSPNRRRAASLAFEACGGRRPRGRFLSNGVKGKRGRREDGEGGRKSSRCRGCGEGRRRRSCLLDRRDFRRL